MRFCCCYAPINYPYPFVNNTNMCCTTFSFTLEALAIVFDKKKQENHVSDLPYNEHLWKMGRYLSSKVCRTNLQCLTK